MNADKKRLRQTISQIRRVKTWQLVIVLILGLFLTATFYRLNNVGMTQRRDAVKAADKAGNPDEIQSRLYDLQRYVVAHMNSDTGVFYLEEQYNRDSQAVIDAAKGNGEGQSVNARAEAVCKPQFSSYSFAYTQCMLNEITKPGQVVDPANMPKMPDSSLYRHDFVSPLWSADFAGFSVLFCLLVVLAIIARAISLLVLKMLLKQHYRGV